MKFQRQEIACFSGHRTVKMYTGEDMSVRLTDALKHAIERGYKCFLSGACEGFDIVAAEACIALRKEYPIKIYAIVPFPAQAKSWAPDVQERYRAMLGEANGVVTLSERYYRGIYHTRNRYMVDKASLLITCFNGAPGGTAYTVRYAKEQELEVQNLYKSE